jgi:hypothetical protein
MRFFNRRTFNKVKIETAIQLKWVAQILGKGSAGLLSKDSGFSQRFCVGGKVSNYSCTGH